MPSGQFGGKTAMLTLLNVPPHIPEHVLLHLLAELGYLPPHHVPVGGRLEGLVPPDALPLPRLAAHPHPGGRHEQEVARLAAEAVWEGRAEGILWASI